MLFIVLYCFGFLVTYGGLLACWAHSFKTLNDYHMWRSDMAVSIAVGLIPVVGWIVTLFFTGFYSYGFVFTRRQWLDAKGVK